MNNLKFRVWDEHQKNWLKNWVGINNLGVVYDDGRGPEDLSLHPSVIIQQYTGCKDKNGKDIYEGDKVRYTNSFGAREGVISFHAGAFFVDWPDQTDDMIGFLQTNDLEIIGNIFDIKNRQ